MITTVGIAKVAYDVIRAYRESQGQFHTPDWANATKQVKLDYYFISDFYLSGSFTPESAHWRWTHRMKATGWSFGHEMNKLERKHPLLASWSNLTSAQRTEWHLFKGVVDALNKPRTDIG